MALTFGPIVSGPYGGNWNSVALGFTIEGYALAIRFMKEMIAQSDLYGKTLVDSIHQGAQADFRYESQVYNANGLGPVSPYGALGVVMSVAKPVGLTDRESSCKPLILTSTANTPAAAAPATLTAPKTCLADNFQVGWLYGSSARKIPVQLTMYAEESATVAGTLQFFGMT